MEENGQKVVKHEYTHWFLIAYDILILLLSGLVVLYLYTGPGSISPEGIGLNMLAAFVLLFLFRIIGGIYRQIWRYGGIQCYIRLLMTDGLAFLAHWFAGNFFQPNQLIFPRLLSFPSFSF